MGREMSDLDASVFQHYTEFLARRATSMVARWTIAGLLVGAGLGAIMLTPWAHWPVTHRQVYLVVLLGAVTCGMLGRSLGSHRALGLKLQAQLAQHQLQFERTALAVGAAAAAAPSHPQPAAAPAQYRPAAVPPQVAAVEPFPVPAPAPVVQQVVAPVPPVVPAGA
ncbi:MAG TPA: hypothetical protein VE088_04255, partial [Gaiellaceae bacterium]|nr:hypothetical protein [Gaiellaceae bacterium]